MEKESNLNVCYDANDDCFLFEYPEYHPNHRKVSLEIENSNVSFEFFVIENQISKAILYQADEFLELMEKYHQGKEYEFECDYDCYWFYGKNHQTLEYQGTTTSSDLLFILDLSKSNQAIRLEIIFGSFLKKILKQTQQKIKQKFCNDNLIFVDIS